MSGKTIEDILVNKEYKKVVKKKKSNIYIIIFLMILIVIACVAGFFLWKHIQDSKIVTAKDLFLKYIVNTNLENVVENDLYKESFKKLVTDDYYMDTSLNFSTTSEIEGFENFDFSKFSIDNNIIRKASNQKVYTNSMIKYLGNDIFDLKTISQSNNFAINSDQIVTKYISGTTDQMNNLIKEVTGYNFNINFGLSIVDGITNSEEIELTEKNILTISKNLVKAIDKNLSEEDVTEKEIIIDSNGEQVSTIAYTAEFEKKELLDVVKTVISDLEDDKVASKLLTGYESVSIFEVGSQKNYETNPEVDLENIIDSSEFIVGAEGNAENTVVENTLPEEAVSGTLSSSTVENENLEYREGVEDETVIGYEPPAVQENNSSNDEGDVINIVTPNITPDTNNNSNNSSTGNSSNSSSSNNTINVVQTPSNNQTTTNTTNTTNNNVSNTTNGGSNISSDVTVDNNTGNNGGAVIPIASLVESVEVIASSGFDRKFTTDIQIIQNPNLTTEEDRLAQEENREMLKEETEELFSSITDAIESNAQIVNDNLDSDSSSSSETLSLEYELIKCLLFKTKMNITYNQYEEVLENFYKKIEDYDFEKMYITVYVAEDKTLKVILQDDNKLQVEIDYIDINDSESKFKYLVLTDSELRTGSMIEVYKSQREASCNYEAVVSWIEEGKIVEKLTTTISTKGTALGSTLNNDIVIKYVKGKDESFQLSANNTIGFISREIEDLSSNNCLYLNSLSNEEYVAIVNAVKNKTVEVLAEKMADLNLIDLNTGNDFVNRVQEEAENRNQEGNGLSKDDARNLIIDRVSILMGEAEARGETVTLDVVRDLTIEGYEVTSAVSNGEAYIVLDGHEFIINSEFTIIDVN